MTFETIQRDVNGLSNSHLIASLVASQAEQDTRHSGSLVSQHLPGIASRHMKISDSLDNILEANEKKGKE